MSSINEYLAKSDEVERRMEEFYTGLIMVEEYALFLAINATCFDAPKHVQQEYPMDLTDASFRLNNISLLWLSGSLDLTSLFAHGRWIYDCIQIDKSARPRMKRIDPNTGLSCN